MRACPGVRLLLQRCLLPLSAFACVALARLPAQVAPPAGTRELDDLSYVLGSEWAVEEVKGAGPDLRAHYAVARQVERGSSFTSTGTVQAGSRSRPQQLREAAAKRLRLTAHGRAEWPAAVG